MPQLTEREIAALIYLLGDETEAVADVDQTERAQQVARFANALLGRL